MPTRVLFSLIILLAASTASAAHRRRRARASLALPGHGDTSNNAGAQLDSERGAAPAIPPLVNVSTTFVEFHSARVEHDLMLFPPTLIGIKSPGRSAELWAARPPAKRRFQFFTPAKATDDLEVRRDRDRMLLFRDPQPQGASVGLGLALFGAITVLSAHAPRVFRAVFDGPVHLGPAIFDGGGMGAGVAGRGL